MPGSFTIPKRISRLWSDRARLSSGKVEQLSPSCASARVDQEGRRVFEIALHDRISRLGDTNLVHSSQHMADPCVPFGRSDLERHVAHAQARMAALCRVGLRTAEALREEEAQVLDGKL